MLRGAGIALFAGRVVLDAWPPIEDAVVSEVTAHCTRAAAGVARHVVAHDVRPRLSDGRISLRPGTLYGALDRLVDAGLVDVDHEQIVEGRLRRYYRLTEPGGEVLAAETERMRRNVKAATARLRAAKAAPRLSRGLA